MKTSLFAAAAFAACAGAHAAPLPCQPQDVLDPNTVSQQVILAGELHGTNEMPAFVAGLACSILQQGRPVVLSLELPGEVQPALDSYLDSDGGDAARQVVYSSRFGKINDGRSSQAYLLLLEQARQLRQAGARISVAATDVTAQQLEEEKRQRREFNARDRIMAANIVALARANPEARIVSLSGNLHASQAKGGMLGEHYEPMGYVIARQLKAYSIGFRHAGGAAWVCLMAEMGKQDCGAHQMGAQTDLTLAGYDRMLGVGKITASPPAARQ